MRGEDVPAGEHTIPTGTHGRYLLLKRHELNGPMLVGFHGYGETADEELDRLAAIPGMERWNLASIQGLHQFYRRKDNAIVASWMTRQNRELSIADNIAYVSNVVASLAQRPAPLVLTGFSQGVAMAFRAAARLHPVAGVIACGGDIPPELTPAELARIPTVLLGRGERDEWYSSDVLAADEVRLRSAGVRIQTALLDAGHEWTPQFSTVCADFLRRLL